MCNQNNIKLSKNVLVYYDHSIEGGKVFLFNAKEEILWTGNNSAYMVIQYLLDNHISIEEIQKCICKKFSGESPDIINESVTMVINDLFEKNFLEVL